MLIKKPALLSALLLFLQLIHGMDRFNLTNKDYDFKTLLGQDEVALAYQIVALEGEWKNNKKMFDNGRQSIELFKAELLGKYEENQVCLVADEDSEAKQVYVSQNFSSINEHFSAINEHFDVFPHTVNKKKIIAFTQKEKLKREMIQVRQDYADERAQFTVMNFNILADGLSSVYDVPGTEKDFVHPNKKYLNWNVRGPQIIQEMQGADIIVVEENDRFDDIYRDLNQGQGKKYDGIIMNKTDSAIANLNTNKIVEAMILEGKDLKAPLPNDGIAIYWNTNKFEYKGALKDFLGAQRKRIIDCKWPINTEFKEGKNMEDFDNQMKKLTKDSQNKKLNEAEQEKIRKKMLDLAKEMEMYEQNECDKALAYIQKFTDTKEKKFTYHGKDPKPKEFTNYTRVLDVEFKNDILVGAYPVRKYYEDAKTPIKGSKEVYIAVKLFHKVAKQQIVVAGTHLKSEKNANGELTRKYQANYLMTQIEQNFNEKYPIVFCADMNAAHVPLMFQKGDKPDLYYPETYQYLTKDIGMVDSQVELMREAGVKQLTVNGKPVFEQIERGYDEYLHYTTAKVREGKASTIVEDYILYKNSNNGQQRITPIAYLQPPSLETIKPLYLPGSHYPSDHIAIRTDFTITRPDVYVNGLMHSLLSKHYEGEYNSLNAPKQDVVIEQLKLLVNIDDQRNINEFCNNHRVNEIYVDNYPVHMQCLETAMLGVESSILDTIAQVNNMHDDMFNN